MSCDLGDITPISCVFYGVLSHARCGIISFYVQILTRIKEGGSNQIQNDIHQLENMLIYRRMDILQE